MPLTAAIGYVALVPRALSSGTWRENRLRCTLSIAGVALGVALGVAVHLINRSAALEFTAAARTLGGDADLVVQGPLAGFDEALYPLLARVPAYDFVGVATKQRSHLGQVFAVVDDRHLGRCRSSGE